jgi:cytidylate kinase
MLIILGYTGTGKTTYAKEVARISAAEDPVVISAGGWVREATGIHEHSVEASRLLAAESLKLLREDPYRAARWIKDRAETCRPVIVEGIRNPLDFTYLYHPSRDLVVWLKHPRMFAANDFEQSGLHAIETYLGFVSTMTSITRFDVTSRTLIHANTVADRLLQDY